MPGVNFRIPDLDEDRSVDVESGTTVMRAAVANDVPGITGECGGEMSCGTCHVYVREQWPDRLPPPDEEAGMLEVIDDPEPTSRLGCQIHVGDDLDGITVTVPHV
ncbi:2Fe-2S iron-sulfur cluster-binding protein [Actinomadura sp. LOL_016]|uniref:2Fe-2S iron-sulfur cluster-binding protein n=1 Tax=unclassified Actinomadura TaxID=2626254 RepID=UPI003A80CDE5